MNGFNIPMPQGLAGASPSALGAAGNVLGGAMGATSGVPSGGGGQPWWYTSPDIMDYVVDMTRIGYDASIAMEALDYQAQRDDANRAQEAELAQADHAAAIEAANIAASASRAAAQAHAAATTESARISAEAQMHAADQALAAATERAEATRYAADQALEGVRLDTETRMKIAAGNLRLESQKAAAQEFGAPSDWIKQVGFLRGMGMTRADVTPEAIRASGEALGPGPPDLGPAPQQAVVGEAGPELATATPQGVQVSPLDTAQAYHLRGQGVPGMQYGGRFSMGPGATQPVISQGGRWQRNPALLSPTGAQALQRQNIQREQRGYQPLTPQRYTASQQAIRQREEEAPPAWFAQWLETQGGAGAQGGAAAPGAGTTPGTPTDAVGVATTANEMPFLETLRTGAYVPLYEGWGGPRTLPEAGITDPVKMPHEYNYADFARWTPTEQSMMFATWQALGMEPTTALEIMRRSAPRGSAGAAVGYG